MAHAKSILVDRLTDLNLGSPSYSTTSTGPQHEQVFSSEVIVDGRVLGTGSATTKREAEREAAQAGLEQLAADAAAEERAAEETEVEDEAFEGPWPIFESVLSQSLQIAQQRVPARLSGDEARDAILDFTLELYKDLLGNLGEVIELDDEET